MRAVFVSLIGIVVVCAIIIALFDRNEDAAAVATRDAAELRAEGSEDARKTGPATASKRRRPGPTMDVAVFLGHAREGMLPKVQRGIAQGIDPNTTDEEGHTALMLAAFDGHTNTVKYLLAEGADPNLYDQNGRSALMYAATGPNAATVRALLDAGAQVNAVDKDEQFNALMFAAAEGHADNVQLLLDHGAEKSTADIDGETALDFARANGHTAVAELLQKKDD